MIRLWQTHRALLIAFLLACALALFFAGQMVVRMVYWSDPAKLRVTPEPWMTPGYIGRSWDLNREQMIEVLGVPGPGQKGRTLSDIAQAQGIPVEDLIALLHAKLPEVAVPK